MDHSEEQHDDDLFADLYDFHRVGLGLGVARNFFADEPSNTAMVTTSQRVHLSHPKQHQQW